MSKLLSVLCRFTTIGLMILLLVMTVVINSVVITRYFFSWSPSWSGELTRYAMVWMVMVGGGILSLFDDHIALTMFVENLRPPLKRLQSAFVQIVVTAIGVLLAWKGWVFAIDGAFILASGLQVSMLWATIAIPISGALVTISGLINLWNLAFQEPDRRHIRIPLQKNYMHGSFKQPSEMESDG